MRHPSRRAAESVHGCDPKTGVTIFKYGRISGECVRNDAERKDTPASAVKTFFSLLSADTNGCNSHLSECMAALLCVTYVQVQ